MEELLEAVGQILEDKPLGSIQRFVLHQSWLGKTYGEMAEGSGYGSDYIKEVGSQLWQDLSDALGERVTKKNLHLVLRRFQQEWMSQDNGQPQRELRAGSSAERGFLDLVPVSKLDYPSGPVPLGSRFYINRPPLEELVYAEIMQPGSLLRIKAPRKMGKSSLLNRIIAHAKVQGGYKTVSLDFQEADEAVFASLDKFLRWFCINISRQLNLAPNLDDYWDAEMGSKVSCKIYFEGYLLEQIDCPLVLALNEVHRVFEHPNIAQDFLPMLRFWHEVAKQDRTWQKVRLVVVHTTEIYIPLKLNQSPFNVGLTVPLPPFTMAQVQNLAIQYGIDWAASSSGAQRLAPLQTMIGGHPYLINLALYHLCQQELTLEELLQTASTPSGIYSQHLRELLTLLQADPQLMSAMQEVVMADESVQFDASAPRGAALNAIAAYKLESMGLVQLDGNQARASCELYRLYFSQQLRQNDNHTSANLLEEQQQSNEITEADALSQFVNLDYFSQYLKIQWQQWLTEATMLSVIMCEIDYFNFYTDAHGYQAGNTSLQRIASTICKCLKYKAALMAHFEGTKFAAVLPQTPADIAVGICENIREGIEQLAIARASSVLYSSQEGQTHLANPEPTLTLRLSERRNSPPQRAIAQAQFQFDGFPAPVLTVSLGIATAKPNHENSPVMLIAAAEEALFQAKRKGRNCVAFNSVLSEEI